MRDFIFMVSPLGNLGMPKTESYGVCAYLQNGRPTVLLSNIFVCRVCLSSKMKGRAVAQLGGS